MNNGRLLPRLIAGAVIVGVAFLLEYFLGLGRFLLLFALTALPIVALFVWASRRYRKRRFPLWVWILLAVFVTAFYTCQIWQIQHPPPLNPGQRNAVTVLLFYVLPAISLLFAAFTAIDFAGEAVSKMSIRSKALRGILFCFFWLLGLLMISRFFW